MRKTKQLLWIGCIGIGLFLAGSTFLMSHAQKQSETKKVEKQNQDEQIRRASAEIAKSVVGSLLFDIISIKESSWELNKGQYLERHEHNKATTIGVSLKKGDKVLAISILECDSVKDADDRFNDVRSYGASVPFNKYGDKGDELIGQDGDLLAIRFRKGNFFVRISTNDLKTAERFAGYVLESLSGSAIK